MTESVESLAIVTETFLITGRGLVGVLDRHAMSDIPPHIQVTIHWPDGSILESEAYVEVVCHSTAPLRESEALFFPGLTKESLPVGSRIVAWNHTPAVRK